jgi:chromosome segregation ATPase
MPDTITPTVPLLQQAKDRLDAALAQERQAKRALDNDAQNPAKAQAFKGAAQEARQAQGQLDRVRHGLRQIEQALPEARRDLVRAESTLSAVEAQVRQLLTNARKQVAQAREAVQTLEAHQRAIVGEADAH